MAELLIQFTDVLLESPQNPHLSQMDSKKMGLMENVSKSEDLSLILANEMADQIFQCLAKEIQTIIALAVYDF